MKTLITIKKEIGGILIAIFLLSVSPLELFASNNGPGSPEASGFEPVDATDMVNLSTGDFSYVLPLLSVPSPEGGYPVSLSYHGGVGYDQESSWVGLGWYLTPGAINRNLVGYADDWNDVEIRDRVAFRTQVESITVGVGFGISKAVEADVSVGISWGSHRSMGGTVSAGIAVGFTKDESGQHKNGAYGRVSVGFGADKGVNASAGLALGGFNAGVGVGSRGTNAQLGYNNLEMSGHFRGGDSSYGVGYNTRDGNGSYMSQGINFSSDGASVYAGMHSGRKTAQDERASSSISMGRFGDTEVSGFNIGIPIGPISLKIGYQKQVYSVDKVKLKNVTGPIYFSNFLNTSTSASNIRDSEFKDLISENKFMDVQEQVLPYRSEQEFAVYRDDTQKQQIAYMSPNYDTYSVSAQGIGGVIKPRFFENANLVSEGINKEVKDGEKWFRVNHHYHVNQLTDKKLENHQYSNLNKSGLFFYFDNSYASTLETKQATLLKKGSVTWNQDLVVENFVTKVDANANRQHSGNFVEAFTNEQIVENGSSIGFLEAKDLDRRKLIVDSEQKIGIGGYRITTADGKVYHYSYPVYHYEELSRTLMDHGDQHIKDGKRFDPNHYKERRMVAPYATHWLLTAITGPDYVKMDNQRSFPDEGDYGYWVRFDYGKFSEGYTWRNPYKAPNQSPTYYNASYDFEKINKEFAFGRKELVYLDRIKTRTHTALFIKKKREDAYGVRVTTSDVPEDYNLYNREDRILDYPEEETLALDQIVLLKNGSSFARNKYLKQTQAPSVVQGRAKYGNLVDYRFFLKEYRNVLDIGDFSNINDLHQQAIKVIQLNTDYSLAKGLLNSVYSGTPNSKADRKGKLTLRSVSFLGKQGIQYLPPIRYDYYGEEELYKNPDGGDYLSSAFTQSRFKDNWGYHKDAPPETWSLKSITTPTGGSIEVKYEKDDYHTEAFSRRYWEDNLQIKFTKENNRRYVYFRPKPTFAEQVDFREYFDIEDNVALDIQYVSNPRKKRCGERVIDFSGELKIDRMEAKLLRFELPNSSLYSGYRYGEKCSRYPWFSIAFYDNGNCPSVVEDFVNFINPYNQGCRALNNDESRLQYRIIANKVPEDETGGGLRVKEVNVKNPITNETLTTEYSYQDILNPSRSSGITSFSPVRGTKFVPYQGEVPSPGVNYKYVTVRSKGADGEYVGGKTVYQFNVLKPHLNIFNPNIHIDDIFQASVSEQRNLPNNIKAKNITLKVNSSAVGALLSVSSYNKHNQLIRKNKTLYFNFDRLQEMNHKVISESFYSMKSVYEGGSEFNIPLKKRLLSTSTKYEYPSIVHGSESVENGLVTQNYKNPIFDPKSGQSLQSLAYLSDGTSVRTTVTPAYQKYTKMGSKVDDPDNKHMLTQNTMTLTEVKNSGSSWSPTSVSIDTWKEGGGYRNPDGSLDDVTGQSIWRKHKSYVWDGEVDENTGVYKSFVSNFNWENPKLSPSEWRNVSEITLFNPFSSPIETRDLNNNYASSKYDPSFEYVTSSGNTRYSELFATGFEFKKGEYVEGDIKVIGEIKQGIAHTGYKSLDLSTGSLEVKFNSGSKQQSEVSTDLRAGKYKVSYWEKYKPSTTSVLKDCILFNGQSINADETLYAGQWKQQIYYIEIPENGTNQSVKVCSRGSYIDDFRMHPVYSSVNSYVYNPCYGELTAILGTNNLATKFEYDAAGRLTKTWQEIVDQGEVFGGFRKVSEHAYSYSNNMKSSSIEDPCNVALIDPNSPSELPLFANFSIQSESRFSFKFDGNESQGTISTYIWDFGDENYFQSNQPIANHTYASIGTYLVKLTVKDNNGNQHSTSRQVKIESEPISGALVLGARNVKFDFCDTNIVKATVSNVTNTGNPMEFWWQYRVLSHGGSNWYDYKQTSNPEVDLEVCRISAGLGKGSSEDVDIRCYIKDSKGNSGYTNVESYIVWNQAK